MLAEERYRKIMELIREKNAVKVSELTGLFSVSTETIRRDLDYLEKEGCLKKVYGGAVLDRMNGTIPKFHEREYQHRKSKSEMAQLVCGIIREGDSVAIDSGTTGLEVARELKHRYENLTVLTNSLVVADELLDSPGFTVILTGGILNQDEKSIVGDVCLSQIRQYRVNYYLMSVGGISLTSGITSFGFGEVAVQKAFAEIASQILVLGGSSYFDKVCLLKVCDLIKTEEILSDSELPEEVRKRYEAAGIRIRTPDDRE